MGVFYYCYTTELVHVYKSYFIQKISTALYKTFVIYSSHLQEGLHNSRPIMRSSLGTKNCSLTNKNEFYRFNRVPMFKMLWIFNEALLSLTALYENLEVVISMALSIWIRRDFCPS